MKGKFFDKDLWLIVLIFLISRIVIRFFGIGMDDMALISYWHYLDLETLRHHLLRGIWYDHAQPPFFNLFLGVILKLSGSSAIAVFDVLFKIITLTNVLLLNYLLKQLTQHRNIVLILTLIYLLSPATLIFECELFYTTLISLLLLTSFCFLIRFQHNRSRMDCLGIFLPLVILCLTRSLYHLFWLMLIMAIILVSYRGKSGFRKLALASFFSVLLVGAWYFKNYLIFGSFSTSTWIGMNLSRNVFHDNEIKDSDRLESIPAFSIITAYKKFISGNDEKKYAGMNDPVLLSVTKNDSFINEHHIDYIEISKKYMAASKSYIKAHPFSYLQNVLQSSIIFFTPATRYSIIEPNSNKIKYYDLIYSFNLSHLATGKYQRRIALTLSAIPQMILYVLVFFFLIRFSLQHRNISLLNLLIVITIAFVFFISSLLEHYENMRFRFEIEPLFLLLLAQVLTSILANMENRRKMAQSQNQPL
jgi:hypothetical protein